MARGTSNNVTAWQLDESVAASDDGVHIPGVPGLWKPGVPVSAEAFGMGVGDFEELVDRLGLPLEKVRVSESKVLTSFERPTDDLRRFDSAPARLGPQGLSAAESSEVAEAADDAAQGTNRAVLEGTAERVESDTTEEDAT